MYYYTIIFKRILEYELYRIFSGIDHIENSENDHSSWQEKQDDGEPQSRSPLPAPHLQTFQERPGYLDLALTLW